MENLKIKDILISCDGKLICGDEQQEINGFSKDTRTIGNGEIFVGIRGETFDGNAYYKQALQNGAIGCILEKHFENQIEKDFLDNKSIIIVEDSVKALQEIANYRRGQFDIPVIAITGSVGKTSTKDIIASTISQKFNVLKTEGNNNNHIGLPLTLLRLKDQEAIVVEMGMNHFGEISLLTNIAKPNICVITNIGTAHIGILGSRENILKAKLEILEGMNENGVVIVNNDNDLLHKWALENKDKYNIITYGINNDSDFMAYNIVGNEDLVKYNIRINNNEYLIEVPVSGEVFVYNSLCGLAVAKQCDMDINSAIEGIKDFKLTKNRMEIHKKGDMTIINDSYNASYDSMKAGLEYLKLANGNRKIAVLGDMLELGEYEKELHEKVGEEVVKNNIDILITIGERARYIASKAQKLGMNNIVSFDTKEEATEYIEKELKSGDAILFKASNSMRFGEIVNKII